MNKSMENDNWQMENLLFDILIDTVCGNSYSRRKRIHITPHGLFLVKHQF